MENLSKKDKLSILKRLKESSPFQHSKQYQDLLSYLVQASIDGKSPKEYSIATDVFHKSTDFDPSQDTIVRVYIYNLRKKLNQYYASEGAGEVIRLGIPKGHYSLEFVPRKKNRVKSKTITTLIVLIACLMISNIFFLVRTTLNSGPSPLTQELSCSPIWKDFCAVDKPKQIVLGDHFFFVENPQSYQDRLIIRRDNINNGKEFEIFSRKQPKGINLKPLPYPMFPRNSVWPYSEIIRFFVQTGQKYNLNYASNVTAEDMRTNNMVFVGSFHTLADFNQTFRNSKIEFKVYLNELRYYDAEKDSVIICPEEGDPMSHHVDYGIARKMPAPNGNTLFLFTSFHETGTVGIVQSFTHPELLANMEDAMMTKFGYIPKFFEIIFKSRGYNRTAYTTDIMYIEEISPSEKFW